MLSQFSNDACVFPRARLLPCAFRLLPPDSTYVWEDAKANISAFVERVKLMAPMVNKVSISSLASGNAQSQAYDASFSRLVSCFCQLANRISYSNDACFELIYLNSMMVCDLVSLECNIYVESFITNIAQVARQNASTLQCLTIAFKLNIGIVDLVQGADGEHVKYSCLNTLFLDLYSDLSALSYSVPGNVVIFPSIRRLTVNRDYPFGDDTLFRGNAATLECLRISPDRHLRGILNKYKVFTPNSHPKLQCVDSVQLLGGAVSQFGSIEAYLKFVLSVAPNTAVLAVPDIPAGEETLLALGLLKEHIHMQVLTLYDTPLMLWEVIHIVKSLPILSDLGCQSTGLGAYSEEVTLDTS